MDFTENAAGVLISAIDDGDLVDFSDLSISYNAANELIASDDANSKDCADTNVLDDFVD